MTYVDGFVAAVPTTNREAYKKHAEAAAVVFKEHGALRVVECWGDDVPDGKISRSRLRLSLRMMRPSSSLGSPGLRARSVIKS